MSPPDPTVILFTAAVSAIVGFLILYTLSVVIRGQTQVHDLQVRVHALRAEYLQELLDLAEEIAIENADHEAAKAAAHAGDEPETAPQTSTAEPKPQPTQAPAPAAAAA